MERKRIHVQNIMKACSFDVQFIFVWARWEEKTHNIRIFLAVIDNLVIKFSKPSKNNL